MPGLINEQPKSIQNFLEIDSAPYTEVHLIIYSMYRVTPLFHFAIYFRVQLNLKF